MNWKTTLILVIILLGVGFIIGWQSTPSIQEVQPFDSPLISRQSLVIVFSRPMNPVSVYAHFSLEPSIQGDLLWNEDFTRASFTPDKSWPSGESIKIRIESGAKSRIGLPLLRDLTENIPISPMSLIYLWPADENSNLYILNPDSGESQQLISEEEGILDYTISGDGMEIIYSHQEDGGTSSIVSFDRLTGSETVLVACSAGLCRSPQISPDEGYLAYEFISNQPGIQPGIQVYDLETDIQTDLGDTGVYLDNPTWSLSGWLSFYNHTRRGYEFWNPDADETIFLPNETGGDGSWSPDGRHFVCSEIQFKSTNLAPRHLLKFDLIEQTLVDLSQGSFLEDLNPSFSPQGSYLAFSRKYLDPEDWTPGRELWVMDLEENQSIQLTDEIDFHHTSFAWHSDGDQLVYVRYNQAKLSEPPEIWLINRDGSDKVRLIINGFAPRWIP
jgi:Tol biopolymer transport system component